MHIYIYIYSHTLAVLFLYTVFPSGERLYRLKLTFRLGHVKKTSHYAKLHKIIYLIFITIYQIAQGHKLGMLGENYCPTQVD